jgi:HK97 family phage major capsid protein
MTPEQLKQELDTLKSSVESIADAKAKAAVLEQIKSIEAKISDAVKDLPALKQQLEEAKSAAETAKQEVADFKAAQVTKDEADKANQEALNNALSDIKALKSAKPKREDLPTLGEAIMTAFNEGDNFKNIEMMATNHKDREKKFSIELKTVGDVSVSANYTGGSRGLQVLSPAIVQTPPRKVHIRQLVPNGTIGQGTEFVFMKENGDGEGAIAPTAEGNTKPQIDIDLVESSVKIETIAGWMRVTRKAMNNIQGFLSFLNARLPEKLLRVEDTQLLNGDGVTPNIKGIMRSGNFTAATTTSSFLGEQLIDGLAQLEDTYDRSATGILLRPVDYYSFFKHKATTSGEYDLPKNFTFDGGVLRISGVPVFMSTGMIADQYIIGDWQMGAQLLIQEGMRIEFFEQDGTNVRENKITIRIEETVAFPVFGSTFFVVGSAGS